MKTITSYLSIFAAIAFLCTTAAADIDMQPKEHGNLKWTEKVYTAAQIDILLQNVSLKEPERRYPMFMIPLNSFSETLYREFEIKATTNNFLNGIGVKELPSKPHKMVYWAASSSNHLYTVSQQLPCTVRKYVCDATSYNDMYSKGLRDGRAYSEYDEHDVLEGEDLNTLTLTNKFPNYVICIIDYDKIDDTKGFAPKEGWCISTNKNLQWVYTRAASNRPGPSPDLYAYERGDSGSVVWNPIFPIKWLTEEEYRTIDWINWEKPAKGQTQSRKEYYKSLFPSAGN